MSRGPTPAIVLLAGLLLAEPAGAVLEAEEIEIKVGIDARRDEMVATLGAWVGQNTGSRNLEGLEVFATALQEPLAALGFAVEMHEGPAIEVPGRGMARTGPLVVGRRSTSLEGAPRFLLVGHYDTVFEPDSPFQELSIDRRGGRASGPGALDMKAGLIVMLEALRALDAGGDLDRASWVVIFNGDEEIGSLGSRGYIEWEARRADLGFVFESAHRNGAMVRSRRGLGQFHLSVEGVAAHAGSAHAQGASAIRDLASKVLEIEALTDYDRGVTLNVGTIRGGTKRNIVPDYAEAWIDLRYDEPEVGEETRLELERIAERVDVEGTHAVLWGRLHRPPKRASDEVDALLEKHATAAADLGIPLPEPVHSGGGTDGSLMSAVGLPTLDTLGAEGGRAHTPQEYVVLRSLSDRAALSAILLRRLARSSHTAVDSPSEAETRSETDPEPAGEGASAAAPSLREAEREAQN